MIDTILNLYFILILINTINKNVTMNVFKIFNGDCDGINRRALTNGNGLFKI